MKTNKKHLAVLCAIGFLALRIVFSVYPAEAAAGMQPTASDNLIVSLRSKSELVPTADGYMRVYFDGEKIGIEYYDDDFAIQRKESLDMELDAWGGFYAGSDAYYLVEGRANRGESDTAEVIRVIKYDTSWKKQGTASITGNPELFGGQVRHPFDYGCVEMAECGGTLYIVTGHEGYVDPDYNQGHQGFLMIAVDKSSMTGSIVSSDLWHSFAQYIACKDSDLYVLEQSEGSRCTKLSRYDEESLNIESLPVLKYGGSRMSAWAIACYASVDGIALSSDHVLCLGTSIDQENYDNISSDTAHNIYLTVTPMSDFSEEATTVKWLTNYSGGGKCFLGTKITKVNDNRFLVSWEEFETSQTADEDDGLSASVLHYVFIDGQGNTISQEFTASAPISDCQPILKGTDIVYYASNANMVNFYSINAESGTFHKKAYRVAGENATWDLKDGVLTISGSGAMSIDPEVHYRHPVSSVLGGFSYPTSANAWKPIRDKVTKIIIDGGITSISEKAFAYFSNLTQVQIQSGVRSIGKQAFYSCRSLTKITIPASVTNIEEDILWTGAYWINDESHVVYATIYAPEGSYALTYAKKNGIRSVVGDGENDAENDTDLNNDNAVSISKAKISGLKSSYAYTGKALKPKVTVKLNGKKLKQGTDYTVSYANNKKTGKATVRITGIRSYKETIEQNFKIVPKKAILSKVTSIKAKMIKVTWKKDLQADGYLIQYAKNAKFTSGKCNITIEKKTTVSKNIPKPMKNKRYYVRVRAYKKIDGKKCYGAWSKAAQVK